MEAREDPGGMTEIRPKGNVELRGYLRVAGCSNARNYMGWPPELECVSIKLKSVF